MLHKCAEHLKKYFNDNNIIYFLGGSRRFKFADKNSDYDFFIKDKDDARCVEFRTDLLNYGFNKSQLLRDYNFQNHWRLNIGNSHIDAIILNSDEFYRLEAEHTIVETNLKSFPNQALLFISHLKRYKKVSGSEIYKVLKSSIGIV